MDNIVIGIAGGSASGKTTLADTINSAFDHRVVMLRHDYYYKSHSDMPLEERRKLNFDHPDAYDNDLIINDLIRLKRGEIVFHPQYSYIEHTRLPELVRMEPGKVIIVEGILIFSDRALRDLMDIKVYIDTDSDLRFIRRLMRDVKERGRDLDSVIGQYLTTTKIMHDTFVEQTKRLADVIIPNNGELNQVAVNMLIDKIHAILGS